MSSTVHVDTHVALWLHAGLKNRLAPAARWLQGSVPVVSPMAVLELQFLHEIGRVPDPAGVILGSLSSETGMSVSRCDWNAVVGLALGYSWTRDPFDRLIAASAIVDSTRLVTCDRTLLKHCPNAVWS